MTVTLSYQEFIALQDMIEAYDNLDRAVERDLSGAEREKIRAARIAAIERSNAARAVFAGGRARALADLPTPAASPVGTGSAKAKAAK